MAVTRAAARKTPKAATPKTKAANAATPKTKAVNAAKARAKAAAANAAKARANAVKVKANADKAVARAKANADRVVAKARASADRAKAAAERAIENAKAKANANAKTIEAKAYAAAKAKILTNTKSIQKAYDNTYASAKAEAKAKEYTNVEAYAAAKAKAAAEKVSKIIASSGTVGQKLSLLERLVRSKAAKYGAGSAAAASAASYMSPEVGKFMFRVITSMGLSAADSAAYVMRILKRVLDAKMIKIYRPKIEELMRQEAALRRKRTLASAWSTTRSVGGAAAEMAGRAGWYGAMAAGKLVTEGGKYGALAAGGLWNVITSVNISVPEKLKFVQIFFGQDVPKYIKDIIADVQRKGAQFVGKRTDLTRIVNFLEGAKVGATSYLKSMAKWIYDVYVARKPGGIEALKSFFGGTLPAFIREMARGKPSLPPPPPLPERSAIVRQIADRLKEALETAGKHGGRAWAGVTERGAQAWAGVKAGVKAGGNAWGNAWASSAEANPKLVEHILLGAGSLVGLGLATYLITQTTKAVYSQPSNDRRRRRSRRHRRR